MLRPVTDSALILDYFEKFLPSPFQYFNYIFFVNAYLKMSSSEKRATLERTLQARSVSDSFDQWSYESTSELCATGLTKESIWIGMAYFLGFF